MIRLGPKTYAALTQQCPETLPPSTFCAFLVEKGLTGSVTLGIPSEGSSAGEQPSEGITSKAVISTKEVINNSSSIIKGGVGEKKKDPYSVRHLPDTVSVPDEILDCDELLREFWSVKKGARSERVWNRLCNKLVVWTPEERRKALEASITNGWGDVFEPRPERSAPRKTETDWDAVQAALPKTPW